MTELINLMIAYVLRVLPGMLAGACVLWTVRKKPGIRIAVYLALFVLLRDAMTPLGLWSFGSDGFFWMRMHPDPLFLIGFGLTCGIISIVLYFADGKNRPLFRWRRGNFAAGMAAGAAGAVIAALPIVLANQSVPLDSRGGAVPSAVLIPLLVFCMLGNLMEESLFRGYVLGYFERFMKSHAAGIASGAVFAFCHIFLALTVTDTGYPLLVFTLWEGVIAGIVGSRYGVIASTITHGGAIFVLSSGLF